MLRRDNERTEIRNKQLDIQRTDYHDSRNGQVNKKKETDRFPPFV